MTIPALPVLVPLTILAFSVLTWRLRVRGALTVLRVAVVGLACVYAAKLLSEVILPFPIRVGAARDHLVPWHLFVDTVPLLTAKADPTGIELNIALFVPLGVLLPLVARGWSLWRVVTVGFLVSLSIELAQLVADVTVSTGRVADVDDLIGNTVGTFVGCLVFRAAVAIPAVARIAAAAAWPTRAASASASS